MNSLFVCGRLITRALVSGVCNYSSTSPCTCAGKSECVTAAQLDAHHNHLGQNRNEERIKNKLLTATCGFSKDRRGFSPSFLKLGRYGDDACFVTRCRAADVLGVADGVGGWRTYGIDPSIFSYSLMQTCERIIATGRFNPMAPAAIIEAGYYELLENKEHILGSSTACLVVLNHANSTMYTANIGDSGFLVFRQGRIIHRSEEQQHYFNTPFQLSLPPPNVHGMVLNDSPDTADTSSFLVQEGDLILVATDGLFDNLPEHKIVQQLASIKDHNLESIQQTVNSLALQAHRLAFDSSYLSPFALRARENGINCVGGKPDDITVLLASVGSGNPVQVAVNTDYG